MNRLAKYKWCWKLVVLTILPTIICFITVGKTCSIYQSVKHDSELIEDILNNDNGYIQNKLSDISVSTHKKGLDDILFSMTTEFGCIVKSFTPKIYNGEYGITLKESEIVLDGDYVCSLQLLDSLENFMLKSISNGNYIKVRSVKFDAVKERAHNSFNNKLQISIIIQELI